MSVLNPNPWVGDIREETYSQRIRIGYNNVRKNWQDAPAYFDDVQLKICGHPVMETWEDNYMQLLAEIAAREKGAVLEVGFGMGISAGYIQTHDIEKHIIIEANKGVFNIARNFARNAAKPVRLIFGFWEDAIAEIGDSSISGILFDTYPLSEAEVHQNHFSFFKQAFRILKPGGILTYYSDEVTNFSGKHRAALQSAGFYNIDSQICQVSPPADCQYWKSKTIMAPIIRK